MIGLGRDGKMSKDEDAASKEGASSRQSCLIHVSFRGILAFWYFVVYGLSV
jgi:hypothetical protein